MKYKFLISHMSLEEKASLMSGADSWNTKEVPSCGVPSMRVSDGPHGMRVQKKTKGDTIGKDQSLPATCFPTASALANSWDAEIIEKMGELLGLEAAADGVSVVLGPGVNIKRSPLCGRNFEYFSEDPFLAGKLASALIRGIQSNGISACVKHFAANSQELLRMSVDSVVDERTLREIYLPAFEAAVKEGGVDTLMTCYNRVNGTFGNENTHLVSDILRGEWGFRGVVMTDWGGNNDRVAAVKAGSTLEMPSCNGITDKQIVAAVRAGELDERLLDEQVDILLQEVFKTGKTLQSGPFRFDRYKHHLFSAEIAAETAVLLKNEDSILPLDKEKSVAVIGDFARNPRIQGAGSSLVNAWNPLIPLDELKKAGVKISGFAKGFERMGKRSSKLMKEAVELARVSDTVLMYLGLDEGGESEGSDREDLLLPANQLNLLRTVASVNPNVIVVLTCGGVLDMSWDSECKAVVHGFLPGQAGALAMAELLTGKRCFSGKLAETFPLRLEDEPSFSWFPGRELTAEYREGIYVGYRYFETAGMPVKYPFGYGLSYTSFEYSDLRADRSRAVFKVKNTGSVAGDEIAQLYIRAKTGGMFRPDRELKGFARVHLEPGEEKELEIALDDRSFAVWSVDANGWVIEPGQYEILVGASVADIRLGAEIAIEGEPVSNPYSDEIFTAYYSAEPDKVSDGAFAALLGRELPPSKWDRTKALTPNDTIAQGQYLSGGIGKIIYSIVFYLRTFLFLTGKKEQSNYVNFVENITYRGMARYTGAFDDEQLAAFLALVNREEGAWKRFLGTLRK